MTPNTLIAILQGVPATIVVTAAALAVGALGGLPLVLARSSSLAVIRIPARTLIELLRGIPPIVWLFIIYFGLAEIVMLDTITSAVVGLGVVSSAYMAEIYRGSLTAVHRGQWDASNALGMSRSTTLARVIGPQVARVSVPAAATYAIGLLKDSSVAYTIGVADIVYFANSESRLTSDAIGPFLLAAGVYVALTIPCAWGARRLDSSLRRRVAR
jgi:polar amino acid transport system permease protein